MRQVEFVAAEMSIVGDSMPLAHPLKLIHSVQRAIVHAAVNQLAMMASVTDSPAFHQSPPLGLYVRCRRLAGYLSPASRSPGARDRYAAPASDCCALAVCAAIQCYQELLVVFVGFPVHAIYRQPWCADCRAQTALFYRPLWIHRSGQRDGTSPSSSVSACLVTVRVADWQSHHSVLVSGTAGFGTV